MDDLLTGLPPFIPVAQLPRASFHLVKELAALEKIENPDQLCPELLDQNLEDLLQQRIELGDENAYFQLGQIQFENKLYCSAWKNFNFGWKKHGDLRAKYQVGVMLYDNMVDSAELRKLPNPRKLACKLFEEIAVAPFGPDYPVGQRDLVYSAAYNVARAYYYGFGYYPDSDKAIEYFKLAANDGDPKASILAQTVLGYIYCGPEHRDLEQAFYWHSEACGNGSVESQAALGVMYLYGLGVKLDWSSALICLSEAAGRGSLYGMASLAYFYYVRKMYTNAAVIASKIAIKGKYEECVTTDCLQNFLQRAKAMGCFLYARCLHLGLGVAKDEAMAKLYYSQSVAYDSALASRYQYMVQHELL